MITLALDTCLGACSAAVIDDGHVVASRSEPMTRGHQERLGPLVRELMMGAGLAFPAIERIGVTVGPGSFTGLRVGLAFAKGLALALGRPCVGVGSLEALAASIDRNGSAAAVIDAGRGAVFLQLFENGAGLTAPDSVDLGVAAARLVEVFADRSFTLVDLAPAARRRLAERPHRPHRRSFARGGGAAGGHRSARPGAPALSACARRQAQGSGVIHPFIDPEAAAAVHALAMDEAWPAETMATLAASPGVYGFSADAGFILARAAGGEAEVLTLPWRPRRAGAASARPCWRLPWRRLAPWRARPCSSRSPPTTSRR